MASAVSLDGYLADGNDEVGPLFDWYSNGDSPVVVDGEKTEFRTSPQTAAYLSEAWSRVGTVIIGRRLFDLTNGWNGRPAVGDRSRAG